MKTLLSLVALVGLFMLAGCGQKGDLQHKADAPPPEMEQSADK